MRDTFENAKVIGSVRFSPWQVSEALKSMNVSHYLSLRGMHRGVSKQIGDRPQVYIVGALHSIRPRMLPHIVFLCGAKTALAQTSAKYMLEDLAPDTIKAVMAKVRPYTFKVNAPSIMDYVNTAVRPSFLMDVQTMLYQISNAGIRKIAQASVIKFFDSKLGPRQLKSLLQGNYATEPILQLMQDPRALHLRDAVARVRAGEDPTAVTLETEFLPFDLLYVMRSSEKSDANT